MLKIAMQLHELRHSFLSIKVIKLKLTETDSPENVFDQK